MLGRCCRAPVGFTAQPRHDPASALAHARDSGSVGPVSWMAFVASLVQSLAWPAGVVVVLLVLRRLVEVLDSAGAPPSSALGGRALAQLAHNRGLISDETLSAVDGLSVLRNLAAHSPSDDIGVGRARDYIALADAVLYALRAQSGR